MINVGDSIEFNQGDADQTMIDGVVTRVWPNGKYVTALVDGKSTYCRGIADVRKIGFHVNYDHTVIGGFRGGERYGVRRRFDTRAAAQEFIDVNAMVCRLPNCSLTTFPL